MGAAHGSESRGPLVGGVAVHRAPGSLFPVPADAVQRVLRVLQPRSERQSAVVAGVSGARVRNDVGEHPDPRVPPHLGDHDEVAVQLAVGGGLDDCVLHHGRGRGVHRECRRVPGVGRAHEVVVLGVGDLALTANQGQRPFLPLLHVGLFGIEAENDIVRDDLERVGESVFHGRRHRLPVRVDGQHESHPVLHLYVVRLHEPRYYFEEILEESTVFPVRQVESREVRLPRENLLDGIENGQDVVPVPPAERRLLREGGANGANSQPRLRRLVRHRESLFLLQLEELFVRAAGEVGGHPAGLRAVSHHEPHARVRTRGRPLGAEDGALPKDVTLHVVVLGGAGAVHDFAAVRRQLGELVGTRVAPLADDALLALALSALLMARVGERAQRVTVAGETPQDVVLIFAAVAAVRIVEVLTTALSGSRLARLVESVGRVAVARAAYRSAPPVPRAHLAGLRLAVAADGIGGVGALARVERAAAAASLLLLLLLLLDTPAPALAQVQVAERETLLRRLAAQGTRRDRGQHRGRERGRAAVRHVLALLRVLLCQDVHAEVVVVADLDLLDAPDEREAGGADFLSHSDLGGELASERVEVVGRLLVLPVVQVQPDLAQHPLDLHVVPHAVGHVARVEADLGRSVAKVVLHHSVDDLEDGLGLVVPQSHGHQLSHPVADGRLETDALQPREPHRG